MKLVDETTQNYTALKIKLTYEESRNNKLIENIKTTRAEGSILVKDLEKLKRAKIVLQKEILKLQSEISIVEKTIHKKKENKNNNDHPRGLVFAKLESINILPVERKNFIKNECSSNLTKSRENRKPSTTLVSSEVLSCQRELEKMRLAFKKQCDVIVSLKSDILTAVKAQKELNFNKCFESASTNINTVVEKTKKDLSIGEINKTKNESKTNTSDISSSVNKNLDIKNKNIFEKNQNSNCDFGSIEIDKNFSFISESPGKNTLKKSTKLVSAAEEAQRFLLCNKVLKFVCSTGGG